METRLNPAPVGARPIQVYTMPGLVLTNRAPVGNGVRNRATIGLVVRWSRGFPRPPWRDAAEELDVWMTIRSS